MTELTKKEAVERTVTAEELSGRPKGSLLKKAAEKFPGMKAVVAGMPLSAATPVMGAKTTTKPDNTQDRKPTIENVEAFQLNSNVGENYDGYSISTTINKNETYQNGTFDTKEDLKRDITSPDNNYVYTMTENMRNGEYNTTYTITDKANGQTYDITYMKDNINQRFNNLSGSEENAQLAADGIKMMMDHGVPRAVADAANNGINLSIKSSQDQGPRDFTVNAQTNIEQKSTTKSGPTINFAQVAQSRGERE